MSSLLPERLKPLRDLWKSGCSSLKEWATENIRVVCRWLQFGGERDARGHKFARIIDVQPRPCSYPLFVYQSIICQRCGKDNPSCHHYCIACRKTIQPLTWRFYVINLLIVPILIALLHYHSVSLAPLAAGLGAWIIAATLTRNAVRVPSDFEQEGYLQRPRTIIHVTMAIFFVYNLYKHIAHTCNLQSSPSSMCAYAGGLDDLFELPNISGLVISLLAGSALLYFSLIAFTRRVLETKVEAYLLIMASVSVAGSSIALTVTEVGTGPADLALKSAAEALLAFGLLALAAAIVSGALGSDLLWLDEPDDGTANGYSPDAQGESKLSSAGADKSENEAQRQIDYNNDQVSTANGYSRQKRISSEQIVRLGAVVGVIFEMTWKVLLCIFLLVRGFGFLLVNWIFDRWRWRGGWIRCFAIVSIFWWFVDFVYLSARHYSFLEFSLYHVIVLVFGPGIALAAIGWTKDIYRVARGYLGASVVAVLLAFIVFSVSRYGVMPYAEKAVVDFYEALAQLNAQDIGL